MKKTIAMLLAAVMLLGLMAGCTGGEQGGETTTAPKETLAHVEDSNTYYLIGTGSGDMGESAWGHNVENLTLVKDTAVTDANIYSVEVTLYAGDCFQICHGGSWTGQMGIGYVEGAEYADGTNSYDGREYTAADKKYAAVKNDAGEVVFYGSDEYNNAFTSWNIFLAEGHDGIYKVTLTTYPSSPSKNSISIEFVEAVAAQEVTHDMQIVGTNNEWSTDGNGIAMTQNDDGTWTGCITVTDEMYAEWLPEGAAAAIKVYNMIDGGWYGDSTGENVYLEKATYAVKYDPATNAVEVAKMDYYIVGTLVDAEGNAVNFSIDPEVCPVLTVADGVASVEFTAYDVSAVADYSWITEQGKAGVMAIKVVYGSSFGVTDWYGAADGDNFYLYEGTYTVSIDIATGTVTVS